nr:GNAT family N-acetyltransferase [Candidatus Sigynarchaeota archaeon]
MVLELTSTMPDKREIVEKSAMVLARAFHDYPEYLYLFPDSRKREKKLFILFKVMSRYCLEHGKVLATSPRLEGVLMYLPPPGDINGFDMVRCGALSIFFKLGIGFIKKQARIIEVVVDARKTHATMPHAYLFLLAVDPSFQGKGFAGQLVKHLTGMLDASHLGCYLETSHAGNVDFYVHHGFELVETKDVPGTALTIRALLRKPSGSTGKK